VKPTDAEIARFMDRVEVLNSGCWYWTGARSRGARNKKWYGSFWFRGKAIRAHRFACDYLGGNGALAPGDHRDHVCGFSMCVNPEHLERVSHAENERRRQERRK
jgi:hypothetical protein